MNGGYVIVPSQLEELLKMRSTWESFERFAKLTRASTEDL